MASLTGATLIIREASATVHFLCQLDWASASHAEARTPAQVLP